MKASIPTSVPAEHSNKSTQENSKQGPNARRSTVIRNPVIPFNIPTLQTESASVKDANVVHPLPHGITGSIEGLSYVSQQSKSTNGNASGGSADSAEEDRSQLSTSSTKQHSFDAKSVASATTFAMDEKESIRPDDSASVRAVDDEDASSTLGRQALYSQDSDIVLPTMKTIAPRSGGGPVTLANRRFQTLINPPRFGDLEAEPSESTVEATTPLITPSTIQDDGLRAPLVPIPPDERLLDALASPKDRLSILQLEERFLYLIKQDEVEFIDLPPQNSYARLLAHKLADYYGLPHHITEDGMSVRIFRGPDVEPPITLAKLARSIPVGPAQPPPPTAVKIMRRAGLNDSTAPSSSASKATSEADHSEEGLASPTDSTPNRDKSKMTREEREAQYKAVRERIFGDFQEFSVSESNSTGENSADMSRSSSSSGKKKNRRQKTPKDDTFEARSAFVANYTHAHGMNPQASYQATQYVDPNAQDFYGSQAPFYGPQVNYGTTPTQAHPGFDSHMATSANAFAADPRQSFGGMDAWSPMAGPQSYYGFPPSQPQPTYPTMNPTPSQMNNHFGMMPQQGGMQQQPAWSNGQFSNFTPRAPSPVSGGPWGGSNMYGYGQQPLTQNYGGSAISSPGASSTFNRSLFNPQTRSFVPSTSSSRAGSRNTNRKKAPSSNGSTQNQTGRINLPSRQSSAGQSSTMPFPTKSHFAPSGSTFDGAEESLQQKYGTPANLPKKPPPSQVQQHFDHNGLGVRNPIVAAPSHSSREGMPGKSDNVSA